MKKLFSIASLALLAASMLMTGCKKDNDGNIFHLKIQQYQGQSKTTIGTDGATLWVNGDEVYVNGATEANIATVSVSSTSATAEVTGDPVNGKYYFFYPGNCSVTGFDASAKSFTYTMPSEFTFDANALKAPMAGVSNGQEVTFANLCTMLKLEFFIIPKKVVITAAENDPLCGSFTAAYGADGWTVSTSSTTNTITILNPYQSPYIYVPQPNGNHQLTITAYKETNDANALVTKSMSESKPMAMSTLYDIPMNAHTFSVSATKKVYFSPGNLKCTIPTNSRLPLQWSFSNNQWDYMTSISKTSGTGNNATFTGGIDVFRWGTSGFGSSQSALPQQYIWIGAYHTNSDLSVDDYDWGYNPITNGGNIGKLWRCLSKDEWSYLLSQRQMVGPRYAKAKINGVSGIIIFPDNVGSTVNNVFDNDNYNYSASSNANRNISINDWNQFYEPLGCVFLPHGYSQKTTESGGTITITASNEIHYWTSTLGDYNNKKSYELVLNVNTSNNPNFWNSLGNGNFDHVRLVRDAN